MKIVWVTNDLWYSKMLRFLFDEKVSHVGAIFNFDGVDLALDLNNPVGSAYDMRFWLHKYNIIYQAEIPLPHDKEIEIYKRCAEYAVLRPYDFDGYYNGMVWGILHKFFGAKLPTVNKWSNHTGSMCQEIIVPILQDQYIQETGFISPIYDFSAMTPEMTMEFLLENTRFNPNWKWTFNG